MTQEITNAEKISKLPWSIFANAANSVFVQFTFFGSVFVLFLNALGLEKAQIGLLLSFFPYTGLIALFIAPLVAQFGYKRTYLFFFGLRKFVTIALLLTPIVASSFGPQATFIYVGVIVFAFAFCRSTAEVGFFPWVQEYVPNALRGKYSALNTMFASSTAFFAVLIAGLVIENSTGLSGFMTLIGIGIGFGLISVWAASHVPGGAPIKDRAMREGVFKNWRVALRDRDFVVYVIGAGLVILATAPLTSFIYLYLKEEIGISEGNVIFIQTGILLGGLASTYVWGWTADRYGSRPIMLTGILFLTLIPICWMMIPRGASWTLYIAIGLACMQGISNMGWFIGSRRTLFVSVVPSDRKSLYMALYYAAIGVIGGTSQLLGGQLVQLSEELSGQLLFIPLSPYTGLFLLAFILPIASFLLLRTVRSDSSVSVDEFAGMFFRGNPFMALTTLVGYHLVREERSVVQMTERLGQTRSPFTIEELLMALADPRYNVRLEALISIARTRSEPRLTEALIKVFNGTELALSSMAAWALGRVGDERAVETLREGVNSPYRSIQAQSIRALGTLQDNASIPTFLEGLGTETDKGVQMAYASSLGKLGAQEAVPMLLPTLREFENDKARLELALALARLVGNDSLFVHLVRQYETDFGTIAFQTLNSAKKKFSQQNQGNEKLLELATKCAGALAREDMDTGVDLLIYLIENLPRNRYNLASLTILDNCAQALADFKAERVEYILLALYVINEGWQG